MSQRPLYLITNWSVLFETYESQRLVKGCSWVAMPNKHDGKSFRRLTREKNSLELYGAWSLLVQIASKCPVRGVLADLDGPLSAEDFEDKTGFPARGFAKMLELAASDRIGWVQKVTDAATITAHCERIQAVFFGRSRSRPKHSADSSESTQAPADSPKRPQASADSDESPQPAETPADSRRFPSVAAPRGRAQADRTEHNRTGQDNTHPADVCAPVDALIETVSFLTSLFGKKRNRLSSRAEHELGRFASDLPLNATQRAMLEWFYGLPKNGEDFILSRRCTSADALAENLFKQLEIAEGYAEQLSAGPGTEKKAGAPDEPEGWQEWLRQTYPAATVPGTWREVPESVRSEFSLKGAA